MLSDKDLLISDLLDDLKEDEGFRALPYEDTVGVLTVGYGHNLEEPLSQYGATALLRDDIRDAIRDVISIFPEFYSYSSTRKRALVNLMFNIGKTRFRGFKKMIAAIHNDDWALASAEAKDSKWYTQVGRRGPKVVTLLK